MTLALLGGKPALERPLTRYSSITPDECRAVDEVMEGQLLSGFLGGVPRGGPYVQRLEELWAAKFNVSHAIACNSATSGLWAAAKCVEPGYFNVPCYTMSATAAAPMLAGHKPVFCDILGEDFNMDISHPLVRAIDIGGDAPLWVVTNLFGHPAMLDAMRKYCDKIGALMIEDNSQSPLAMENGRYAGTIGHIGVFSLNVHKHIQCGEGGVVVTNDGVLADRIRGFINHGEMASQGIGLNLRMTELTAAIAIEQLKKIDGAVRSRQVHAEFLQKEAAGKDWLIPPSIRKNCTHVFYAVCWKYQKEKLGISRSMLAKAMEAEGFPLAEGYVKPLYHLPAFGAYHSHCDVAERMHNEELIYFENCAWDMEPEQAFQFGQALKKIEDNIGRLRRAA